MPATTYAVSGMSCGHCKATLTKVIGELTGVSGVGVGDARAPDTGTSAA